LSAFLFVLRFKGSMLIDILQLIIRGGIIETTVDHSDIRGLATACHVFVAERSLSNVGS
jgi:xanthine/uracil/vitamin C permease (AzgA family)